jgi:putative ABC transport system ATP-binding protein/lipoprotein-releasing system ATP-binding protein
MIELKSVSKIYPINEDMNVTAVHDVDLVIQPGEFVVITGRSGSGKTTLLNLIAGTAKPTSGLVLWDEKNIWSLRDHEQSRLRNQRVGFVFQFPSLLPGLNSLENVVLPAIFSQNGARKNSYERAVQLLQTVGLADKLYSLPRQLSAGQQQRVVVARALLQEPQLLLADEPTSDLDEETEIEIMDLIRQIQSQAGITVVLVTHTKQLVSYGTRAVEMVSGRIGQQGLVPV